MKEANFVEVFEDLGQGMVSNATTTATAFAVFDIGVFREQQSRGGRRRRSESFRVKELGKKLKGLDDSTKNESEEVRERVARLVGGRGDSQI